jgi:hypothetical protein
LADEQSRLRTRAKDVRESEFIDKMFTGLGTILSNNIGESRESEFRKVLAEQSEQAERERNGGVAASSGSPPAESTGPPAQSGNNAENPQ